MPELPEVETVRRGLTRLVGGAEVKSVEVLYPKMMVPSAQPFIEFLKDVTLTRIDRRGKYLLLRFSNGMTIVSHLRMEGKYDVQPEGTPLTKHTHVVFHLADDRQLRYADTRKFGRMMLIATGEENSVPGLRDLGPEPTEDELTVDYMWQIFQKSHRHIKPFLLDQSKISGLGNIYVDEVLWVSEIHPLTTTNALSRDEIQVLRDNIIAEIKMAIDGHGTTVHSFSTAYGEAGEFQNHLHVYGRAGEPCDRCGTTLVKTKVAQRGTTYCPHDQIEKQGK